LTKISSSGNERVKFGVGPFVILWSVYLASYANLNAGGSIPSYLLDLNDESSNALNSSGVLLAISVSPNSSSLFFIVLNPIFISF